MTESSAWRHDWIMGTRVVIDADGCYWDETGYDEFTCREDDGSASPLKLTLGRLTHHRGVRWVLPKALADDGVEK